LATEVTLPALGESVTEGTVTRWLKNVGDTIAVDEPLLEVSTDKVDTEIPSPVAGTLLEIRANEDDTVEVGAVLAVVGAADEAGSESSSDAPAPAAEEQGDAQQQGDGQQQGGADEEQAQAPEAASAPTRPEEEAEQPAAGTQSAGGSGTSVTLPALGESVTEGTVTRWLKQVGDSVAVDEPLLEVSTDKVDTEIPSPVAGTLLEIKVSEDETVEVGAELAVVGDASAASAQPEPAAPSEPETQQEQAQPEAQQQQAQQQQTQQEAQPEPQQAQQAQAEAPAPAAPASPAAAPAPVATAPAEPATPAASAPSGEGHGYVTPLVRKLAAQHGVDLAGVTGTGVGGRIRKEDVLAAAEAAKAPAAAPAAPAAAAPAAAAPVSPSPLRGTTEKVSRLRRVIADRMTESLHTSAQLTQVMEVDVTNIARLRESAKAAFQAREGVKLTYLPFFAKAAIDTLKQHPKLNANLNTEAGEVTYYDRENIAFAVDTERGLLTPVVKDAGDLSIAGLAKKIADVAERTRTNKITPDELSGGTFTITNLGSFGALFDTPIINQPQVAILGPGAVVKRPVVIDDPNLGETIAVRYMVYLALTYDHRLVDGADAGRFLQDIKKRLESAAFEV
jgi:pyruvate dehydrogenase E2 component (dihydrolipoamide acetyltransferase)